MFGCHLLEVCYFIKRDRKGLDPEERGDGGSSVGICNHIPGEGPSSGGVAQHKTDPQYFCMTFSVFAICIFVVVV